jgi:hypothetical protein
MINIGRQDLELEKKRICINIFVFSYILLLQTLYHKNIFDQYVYKSENVPTSVKFCFQYYLSEGFL